MSERKESTLAARVAAYHGVYDAAAMHFHTVVPINGFEKCSVCGGYEFYLLHLPPSLPSSLFEDYDDGGDEEDWGRRRRR